MPRWRALNAWRAAGDGPALARLRQPRHVPQLRPPRRGVRRRGAPPARSEAAMKFASTLTGLLQRGGAGPIRRAPKIAWRQAAPRARLDLLLIWSRSACCCSVWSWCFGLDRDRRGQPLPPTSRTTFLAAPCGLPCRRHRPGLMAFQPPMARWQQLAPALFVAGDAVVVVLIPASVARSMAHSAGSRSGRGTCSPPSS